MSVRPDWLTCLRRGNEVLGVELVGCPMVLELRRGWMVRRQRLDRDLVYFCLEGGFEIRAPGRPRAVRPGDVVVVPAGRAFHFALGVRPRARIARFRLQWSRGGLAPGGALRIYGFGDATEAWLSVLRTELAGTARREAVSLAVRGLFLSVDRSVSRDRPGRWRHLTASEKERIRAWAENLAPASRPGLADLARILEMSPDYCARLFRQAFGQSFEAWLIANRMRSAAVRLLESSLTINAVAEEYGFNTPFFFSRQFKAIMGRSPRHFRADQP